MRMKIKFRAPKKGKMPTTPPVPSARQQHLVPYRRMKGGNVSDSFATIQNEHPYVAYDSPPSVPSSISSAISLALLTQMYHSLPFSETTSFTVIAGTPFSTWSGTASGFSMTLATSWISGHRPSSLSFTAFTHQSRILSVSSQSTSLSIRASSNESGGNAQGVGGPTKDPTKDTRIHWGSSDEGWLGTPQSPDSNASQTDEVLSTWRSGKTDTLMGLLVHAADSHYRYLELTPDADVEEIKAAYRRLSKTYHPDTTQLPLDLAAEKFVRLKEAYDVLMSEEQRRLYDWQLAQSLVPQQGGRTIFTSEYGGKSMADDGTRLAQAPEDSDFIDNPVDTMGGRNMDLSYQAQAAIVFDAFAIMVSIFCIVYVIFFKQT